MRFVLFCADVSAVLSPSGCETDLNLGLLNVMEITVSSSKKHLSAYFAFLLMEY